MPHGKASKPLDMLELLRHHALNRPDALAFIFLKDGEDRQEAITFSLLDQKARAIGAWLQTRLKPGERALILYPPGLEYICAFFGCLYAGIIAVPAYPPDPNRLQRTLPRLRAIAAQCQARAVLTLDEMLAVADSLRLTPEMKPPAWQGSDRIPLEGAKHWQPPKISASTPAFLQYTSGSTGKPKGVMLSHGNLIHNQELIKTIKRHDEKTLHVCWLPLYHDMGLIGNMLQAVYLGTPCVLMSPIHFLQKPIAWLRAISNFRATTSGGPNFAYDYCVHKMGPEESRGLDLKSWRIAFNGAEPIRAGTLTRFEKRFAAAGFQAKAFFPCYGLAEATLVVSGSRPDQPPLIGRFQADALARGRALPAEEQHGSGRVLVGSGRCLGDQTALIVDPESLEPKGEGLVGEVWLSGKSVAMGYWQNETATRQCFQARPRGGEGHFLRTGDLGFMLAGELFITGRLKDLLIIRGLNVYPQDIEQSVECCHPALRPGCVAAFGVEHQDGERLVVVGESKESADHEAVITRIRQTISREHEIHAHAVVLIKPRTIPKTTSGKIQRHACKRAFETDRLAVSALDTSAEIAAADPLPSPASLLRMDPQARERVILDRLRAYLAARLSMTPETLSSLDPLNSLGLDSMAAIEFQNQVETAWGCRLPLSRLLGGLNLKQVVEAIVPLLRRVDKHRTALPPGGNGGPCSHNQRALWFLHQLAPTGAAYNAFGALACDGPLDIARLERAFRLLAQRHEALRTTFHLQKGEPVKRVGPAENHWLTVAEATTWSEARLRTELSTQAHRPFDLERGPLIRILLFRRAARDHVLLLVFHHLIADFWSAEILLREWMLLYETPDPQRNTLPALECNESGWVTRQNSLLERDKQLETFWRKRLSGKLPRLDLATDKPRPPVQTYAGACHYFAWDAALQERLKRLCRNRGITMNTVLLGLFQMLLGRSSGQHHFLLGSLASGRSHAMLTHVVGYLANPLVLRVQLDPNMLFPRFLIRVRDETLAALDHQDYPFGLLVERENPRRDASRSPLFQSMFVFQRAHDRRTQTLTACAMGREAEPISLGDLSMRSVAVAAKIAQFDLKLTMAEGGNALWGAIEYNTDLFEAATMTRLELHLKHLLSGILDHDGKRLADYAILSNSELRNLLESWNGKGRAVLEAPAHSGLHQAFRAQARRAGDRIATAGENAQFSYAFLDAISDRVADRLRTQAAEPEPLIGIFMERSPELVAAILAILKTGGAYLPLDPAYPAERIHTMVTDSGAGMVLTSRSLENRLTAQLPRLVWENVFTGEAAEPSASALVDADRLAYVIYTSGSTGKPKGVQITHGNVLRLFSQTRPRFDFGSQDVWPLFHSCSFDLSVWEIWGAFLHGGRLLPMSQELVRNPQACYAELRAQGATVLTQTPSAFGELQAAALRLGPHRSPLRWLIFAGEALDFNRLQDWVTAFGDRRPQLVNMHGITETTIHDSFRRIRAEEVVRPKEGSGIGNPIVGFEMVLLDAQGWPVPIGIAGELHVGGSGLARGYRHDADLTAARFIPDPFSGRLGARLYKSGDQVRFDRRGEFVFLGRMDHQIKLRGFRIEPDEIQAVLNGHPDLKQSLVVGDRYPSERRSSGQTYLAAYLLPRPGRILTIEQCRDFLARRLPDYMVPHHFFMLDGFPLTANGKIDRARLPRPDGFRPGLETSYLPARNPTEHLLTQIWSAVLKVDRVGIDDNFFGLGGDSIRSIRVIAKARERGLSFAIQDLFRYQTVRALAALPGIGAAPQAESAPAEAFELLHPGDRSRLQNDPAVLDAYPITMAQKALIYQSQTHATYEIYVTSLWIEAPLDPRAMKAAIDQLVSDHAFLRSSLHLTGYEQPLQLIHQKLDLPLPLIDLSSLEPTQRQECLAHWLNLEKRHRFQWDHPPHLRFTLHRRNRESFQLTLSDVSLDGWCVATVLTEVLQNYWRCLRGRPLRSDPPRSSYRHFALLEKAAIASELQRDYWDNYLRHAGPTVIPRWPGADPEDLRRGRETLVIEPNLGRALRALATDLKLPIRSVLLSAHLAVLGFLTGNREIITGLELNGRPESLDGDRVLGVFNNMLPLRLRLGRGSWRDLVHRTFAAERRILPYRRYPYALLQREHGRTPLFDAVFVFTHFHVYDGVKDLKPLKILGSFAGDHTYVGLTVHFNQELFSSRLQLLLDFDYADFPPDQIKTMTAYYLKALTCLAFQARSPLEQADLRTAAVRPLREVLPLPTTRPVMAEFEAQAATTPDRIALSGPYVQCSYESLNRFANGLAKRLENLGLPPETRVAVCCERRPELIAGILAVLKTGNAFVPLEPGTPPQRLRWMVAEADCRAVMTQTSTAALFEAGNTPILLLNHSAPAAFHGGNPNKTIRDEQLAYAIFTSGSTGKPKAVAVSHGALSAYVAGCTGYPYGEGSLLHTSPAFDLSLTALFPTLLAGKRIYLVPDGMDSLSRALQTGALRGALKLTPSHLRTLNLQLPTQRNFPAPTALIIGGEQLHGSDLEPWLNGDTRIFNEYGPTEATVGCCVYEVHARPSKAKPVPIGSAMVGRRLAVFSRAMTPMPDGYPGHLHIAGPGLARCYLNRPAATAEVFVPDPEGDRPGERIYRSGDLVRRLPHGDLEWLDRIDRQFKIRGFRIEPQEIETALCRHPDIAAAVVLTGNDSGRQAQLWAYLVAADSVRCEYEPLRGFLEDLLPDYMLPTRLVWIPALPLKANGKIDRRRLEEMEPAAITNGPTRPMNGVERTLAAIWGQVLERDAPGLEDNYFELGGDSILAIMLVAKAQEQGLFFDIHQLFQQPTIARLAPLVSLQVPIPSAPTLSKGADPRRNRFAMAGLSDEVLSRLTRQIGPVEALYPLTPMQAGLLFHALEDPQSAAYWVQVQCRLRGTLDRALFESCWRRVIRRHPATRTSFHWDDLPHPLQAVQGNTRFALHQLDWNHLDKAEQQHQLERYLESDRPHIRELSGAPLMRLTLMKLGLDHQQLVWSHHHLMMDGWSQQLLLKEVFQFYTNALKGQTRQLPEPPAFEAYLQWSSQTHEPEPARYWSEYFVDFDPPLPSPPEPGQKPGDRQQEQILRLPLEQLEQFSRKQKLTLSLLVQAAWSFSLAFASSSRDICFGTTVSGRAGTLPGVEQIVGVLINTLPVRVRLPPRETLAAWLTSLHRTRTTWQRFENTPLVDIRRWAQTPPDRLLFESILVFEKFPFQLTAHPAPGLHLSQIRNRVREHYPLILEATPDGMLQFRIKYDPTRFSKREIDIYLLSLKWFLAKVHDLQETRLEQLFVLWERECQSHRQDWDRHRTDRHRSALRRFKRKVEKATTVEPRPVAGDS